MFNEFSALTKLVVVGLSCALVPTGFASAAALSLPARLPDIGSIATSAQPIPGVGNDQGVGLVTEAHLYLNFAPTWLKMLGRSSEAAENMRGTGHYDVGAIRRRDQSSYELTMFYVDNGLDGVRQGLEKTCTTSGGKVDDKTGAATHVVYCLAPAQ